MADNWSREEVAATVAEYLEMLTHELRGEPYVKRDHNRRLEKLLQGRSAGAIEFKFANISAIMIESGYPYIDGYKPRKNYQELLREEVLLHLERANDLASAVDSVVQSEAELSDSQLVLEELFVPAPETQLERQKTLERRAPARPFGTMVNYLERESRNASLGLAGERLVLEAEHQRLWKAGATQLADRIEHVSVSRGDGLGYDIHSFESDGRDILIEVKTTAFGRLTPFFASSREVSFSEERAREYKLYRVFNFRESPKIFVLSGALKDSCVVDPVQFRLSLR